MKLLLRLAIIFPNIQYFRLKTIKKTSRPNLIYFLFCVIANLSAVTLCGCMVDFSPQDETKFPSYDTNDEVDEEEDFDSTSIDDETSVVSSGSDTFDTYTDTSDTVNTSDTVDTSPEESITISHSASQKVLEHNSLACISETDGPHLANSYYRVFDLVEFGITSDFEISMIEIGIQIARAGFLGVQPAMLRLYTFTGPFSKNSNLKSLKNANVTIKNTATAIVRIGIHATVPAGSSLVVEFHMPDGRDGDNVLRIGSNGAGETSPTYIMAPECNLDEPTQMEDSRDKPSYDVHWVMNVIGTHVP